MLTKSTFGVNYCVIFFLASVTAKSKYYNGDIRPYEFGYRLEDNQHRHEKKDANGLINGDFGFITGDGAYHETVYATDENGNFKLLSLKSSFRTVTSTTTTSTTTIPPLPVSDATKTLKSCSNCKVYEKEVYDKSRSTAPAVFPATTKGESLKNSVNHIEESVKEHPASRSTAPAVFPATTKGESLKNSVNHIEESVKEHPASRSTAPAVFPATTKGESLKNSVNHIEESVKEHPAQVDQINMPKMTIKSNSGITNSISPLGVAIAISTAGIKSSQQIKLKHNEREKIHSQKIEKPVHLIEEPVPVALQRKSETLSADDNIQPKLSKTHLSSKKAVNDFIGDLLYRFNYTTGYHGHNEEGDSAGNKRGGYFIIGRDNIRRGVIYVANANGFIPMIKYEKVSASETPNGAENSAALRGYKFEWFHGGKSKIENSSRNRK